MADAAFLQHLLSQTQANITFLASQGYIPTTDALHLRALCLAYNLLQIVYTVVEMYLTCQPNFDPSLSHIHYIAILITPSAIFVNYPVLSYP